MGEEEWRIFVVGNPSLDAIHNIERLDRTSICQKLDIPDNKPYYIVTIHPETLKSDLGYKGLDALLNILAINKSNSVVITGVNADEGEGDFKARIRAFIKNNSHAVFHESLGQTLYLNAISNAAAVLGNSSSGLYEAPSFAVPTVNIGARQAGRLRANSVFDCQDNESSIEQALAEHRILQRRCSEKSIR